jgi:hypothetical protein
MKTSIRTHVAALALLLPVAVSLLPATAAAQHRWNQPQLSALAVDSDGGLAPGATLSLRLSATPGARWTDVRLGDSGVVVALREERPGLYVGSYTLRRRDRIDAGDMVRARAAYGDRTYTASFGLPPRLQADSRGWRGDRDERGWRGERGDRDERGGRDARRDVTGPVVAHVFPADGARLPETRARIAAGFGDDSAGVDPSSVRLRVDGRDVTGRARITASEVDYTTDLPRGRHTAELTVRDRAGNSSTRAWTFEVAPNERAERAAPAAPLPPVALQLTSPADNAVVDARGGNIVVTGRTAPGATVQVDATAMGELGGGYKINQSIGSNTVRADAQGNFSLTIVPQARPEARDLRYEVRVKASINGAQATEQRLMLQQRQG